MESQVADHSATFVVSSARTQWSLTSFLARPGAIASRVLTTEHQGAARAQLAVAVGPAMVAVIVTTVDARPLRTALATALMSQLGVVVQRSLVSSRTVTWSARRAPRLLSPASWSARRGGGVIPTWTMTKARFCLHRSRCIIRHRATSPKYQFMAQPSVVHAIFLRGVKWHRHHLRRSVQRRIRTGRDHEEVC